MKSTVELLVFGEVLFDLFPSGERVLGGAPFNVAWHLQAFGDQPQFLSRIGDDEAGREILRLMKAWGMSIVGVQQDQSHPTGQVQIDMIDAEPHYQIVTDSAYDFIAADQIVLPKDGDILYHGTLALRNPTARAALEKVLADRKISVFLDVNLRAPWWQQDEVHTWLKSARWVKLNQQELRQLGFSEPNLAEALATFQEKFSLDQVILTRGKDGALVRTSAGKTHQIVPEPAVQFIDVVGAGDAFSAVYLHGILAGWSIPATLTAAQRFASKVVGLRGATTTDREFYQQFLEALP